MCKILLFVFLQFLAFLSFSQVKLDKNSIIIDELGNHYSYEKWRAIQIKGNHYLSYRKEGDKTVFVIKKYPEEQKQQEQQNKSNISVAPKPASSPAFTEGEAFKYFNITTLDGEKIKKEMLAGKVLVFNFWFINCSPCRKEIPALNDLVGKYKEQKDILFLGVALDESFEIKEFMKNQPFLYTQVKNGRNISTKNKIQSYPTHLVVDKEGNIRFSGKGLASNTLFWIDKTIQEVL